MERFEHLGRALKLLRRRRGITQRELARRAGVSASRIRVWEQDREQPTLASLGRLVVALGADLGELDEALASAGGWQVSHHRDRNRHRPESLTSTEVAQHLLGEGSVLPSTRAMRLAELLEIAIDFLRDRSGRSEDPTASS
jgi:transcriptional regulator with XRE-family HTH domain